VCVPLSTAAVAVDRRKDCPRISLSSDAEATIVPAMILMLPPYLKGRQAGNVRRANQRSLVILATLGHAASAALLGIRTI
jgi:hypothetical protein